MLRSLFMLLVACFLFAGKSLAMDKENKENYLTPKKLKIERDPITPTKAEKIFLSPIKRLLAQEEYKNGPEKAAVDSSYVKKIFSKFDTGTYFKGEMTIRGKRILRTNLYNSDAPVLHKGKWITNLQRMEMGLTPIGRKGIIPVEDRTKYTQKEVYSKQRKNEIQLHHIAQDNEGPIIEMTRPAHNGNNARLIWEKGSESQPVNIVHSGLEREQAEALLQENQYVVSNVLHFKKGPSLIDRKEWNEIREEYWQTNSEEIKNKKEDFFLSAKVFLFK